MSVLLLLLNLREDEAKVMVSATQSGLLFEEALIPRLSRIRIVQAISYILVWNRLFQNRTQIM